MNGLPAFVRSDHGALVRHLAVLLAAITAFLLRERLEVPSGMPRNAVPWLLGGAALLNFLLYLGFTSGPERLRRPARALSSLLGVAAWTTLVGLTGGARISPFVAGLGLEIVLCALTSSSTRTVAGVTGVAISSLWLQELPRGLSQATFALALQSGFLLALGGVVEWTLRRWRREQRDLARSLAEQEGRLLALSHELEDSRNVGRLGEEAGRLGHGLKNAVHGMRGLVKLMRAGNSRPEDARILASLDGAIEELESLARETLARRGASGEDDSAQGEGVQPVVEDVVRRLGEAFPGVRCQARLQAPPPEFRIPTGVLREVVTNLLWNAAEAVQGRGEIAVESRCELGEWRIEVRDQGEGVPERARDTLFRPGFTTKDNGSGFGLYLCRRLVEKCGGHILLLQPRGRGAAFQVAFPIGKGS